MKPLYTQEAFNLAKSKDLLPLKCKQCNETFYRTKHKIHAFLNPNEKQNGIYCSLKCFGYSKITKQSVKCLNCDELFLKKQCEIKKNHNHFCSRSCSASYNNKNKSHGTRRSKLEEWIEEQLIIIYPNLIIEFNQKSAIESELDIYIPSLNIAFELNGIFHYEPIYGIDKLEQIQSNDISKSKACFDHKIDLCVIDTSQQKYFKPSTSQKYLDIITKIINERLLTS